MSKLTDELRHSKYAYVVGFVLSLALTLMAFYLVDREAMSRNLLVGFISTLAIAQFVVQLYFFLHLGQEAKPRLKQLTFWFMLSTVLIVVIGSLWIMANLNYNMMSPEQTKQYIDDQNGF